MLIKPNSRKVLSNRATDRQTGMVTYGVLRSITNGTKTDSCYLTLPSYSLLYIYIFHIHFIHSFLDFNPEALPIRVKVFM